jgi:membrane-associated phospholipid phosphatase
MFMSIASLVAVGYFSIPQRLVGLTWGIVGVLLQVVPSVIFYTIRLRQGAYADEDISVRQQRNELYLFSLGTLAVNVVVFLLLQVPGDFIALFSSALVVSVGAGIVNLFWKISIHASSASSCAAVCTIYMPPLGAALWVATLLVGWARVRTRNHSPLQVVAGVVLAATSVYATFALWGIL